jgi:hypothetical protein
VSRLVSLTRIDDEVVYVNPSWVMMVSPAPSESNKWTNVSLWPLTGLSTLTVVGSTEVIAALLGWEAP